ncbi:MAG: M81 family metallopeptidase [Betaproteobacteria bacterium]
MRVFVAGLMHETCSFSPIPTSRSSFERGFFHRAEGGVPDERCKTFLMYGELVSQALKAGHQVVASTCAFAEPSGPCARVDYESLRDEILSDLRAAMPVDMVLYALHGAQMAQGYDDCEGDLLARTRAIVGVSTFVGVELDLHANVTSMMVQTADVLLACKNYPHTDFNEQAIHLFQLGERAARREISPVTHFERVPMLGFFYTTEPRLAALNGNAAGYEGQDGILSVSLIHGFPWADTSATGAGVLVVSDEKRNLASQLARSLAERFFEVREETRSKYHSIDESLARVENAPLESSARPFVIADLSDNAGGGAGSDATFILKAVLERKLSGFGFAMFWDPVVASLAADAGAGAEIRIRLGGKTGPWAGVPLDVDARVISIRSDATQSGIGFRNELGLTVALDVEGNVVVVNSNRQQVFSPDCFTQLGIDVRTLRAAVVKSTQHFHAAFAPFAREIIYCETPGLLGVRFNASNYQKLQRPIWPIDEIHQGAGPLQ